MSEGTQGKARKQRVEGKADNINKFLGSEAASPPNRSSTGEVGHRALRTLIGNPASADTTDHTQARRFFDVRSYVQNLVRFTIF